MVVNKLSGKKVLLDVKMEHIDFIGTTYTQIKTCERRQGNHINREGCGYSVSTKCLKIVKTIHHHVWEYETGKSFHRQESGNEREIWGLRTLNLNVTDS